MHHVVRERQRIPSIAVQLAEQGRQQSGESDDVRGLVEAGQAATSIPLHKEPVQRTRWFSCSSNTSPLPYALAKEEKGQLGSFVQTDYVNQHWDKLGNDGSERGQGADQHQLIENRYRRVVKMKRLHRIVQLGFTVSQNTIQKIKVLCICRVVILVFALTNLYELVIAGIQRAYEIHRANPRLNMRLIQALFQLHKTHHGMLPLDTQTFQNDSSCHGTYQ